MKWIVGTKGLTADPAGVCSRPASGARPSGWVAAADGCAARGTDDHPFVLRGVSVLTTLLGPADPPRGKELGNGVAGSIVCSDDRDRSCTRSPRGQAPRCARREATTSRTSDRDRASTAQDRASRRQNRSGIDIRRSVPVRAKPDMRFDRRQHGASLLSHIRQFSLTDCHCIVGRLIQESAMLRRIQGARQGIETPNFRSLHVVTANRD